MAMTQEVLPGLASSGAHISKDGLYRYALWREAWAPPGAPRCLFLMLNPSTADGLVDDPTIRRCIDFCKRWGGYALDVGNLWAYRASKPAALKKVALPVGPENDEHLERLIRSASRIVCAWGVNAQGVDKGARAARVLTLIRVLNKEPLAFSLTKNGQPEHPLYVPRIDVPVPIAEALVRERKKRKAA